MFGVLGLYNFASNPNDFSVQCAAESENFFSGMGNGKILIEYKSLPRFSSARLAAQKLNEQQSVKSKKVF